MDKLSMSIGHVMLFKVFWSFISTCLVSFIVLSYLKESIKSVLIRTSVKGLVIYIGFILADKKSSSTNLRAWIGEHRMVNGNFGYILLIEMLEFWVSLIGGEHSTVLDEGKD